MVDVQDFKALFKRNQDSFSDQKYMYQLAVLSLVNFRPPIVDSLFPVTRPNGNFKAAWKLIIAFDSHVT